ncbi:MAG: FAD-binding protein [Myxococcales bacterium]|nr:FAD-binding protein [Myxococcales bacterium]
MRRPAFPRMSAVDADRLRSSLARALGDSKVLVGEDLVHGYAGDESEQEPVLPDVVVLASDRDDVVATLRIASELGAPVTPRGAGTGKSGGCVPVCGGVALAMVGMAQIKEIDPKEQLAVVEPGLVLAELHAAVEAEGLFYPPDPNSLKMCVLGGNIAENAGGPRAFKYGVTRDYVLGLEVVTAEGTPLFVGRRTKKGVTGYDVTALLVGSEGTLAVTTACTLRLVRKPDAVATLLGLFANIDTAMRAVADIVGGTTKGRGLVPRCLEVMDETCVAALRDEGFGVDARAGALLILEVDGDAIEVERAMEEVGSRAIDAGAADVLAAQDEAQRGRLWDARRQFSLVTRKLARSKISEDVVVPRTMLASFVGQVRAISERHQVRMLTYGHAGDGNMHVNLLWDDPADEPRVELALLELFHAVIAMRGTLTGEHGIGTSKAQYLALEQSSELIGLQRRIKDSFDPKGILNPGKIFPRTGHGSC